MFTNPVEAIIKIKSLEDADIIHQILDTMDCLDPLAMQLLLYLANWEIDNLHLYV